MAPRTAEHFPWLMPISYLLALLPNSLSVERDTALLLPPFGLLLLFYWAQRDLNRTHFMAAIAVGLLYDALTGSLLGLHGLLFSVLLFVFLRFRRRFRLVPIIQQSGFILTLLYLYQLLNLPFLYSHAETMTWFPYLTMPLTALLAWPMMKYLLDWLTTLTASPHE